MIGKKIEFQYSQDQAIDKRAGRYGARNVVQGNSEMLTKVIQKCKSFQKLSILLPERSPVDPWRQGARDCQDAQRVDRTLF